MSDAESIKDRPKKDADQSILFSKATASCTAIPESQSGVAVPRPDPVTLTEEQLRGQLLQHFKHSEFKSKLQHDAIREVLRRKHDVYISMPTGSGKSLCFQLPGLLYDNRVTVVFSPLLALIKDQIDHLTRLRIRAESINSKMTGRERDSVYADLRSVRPETRFLYITPEQGASEQCRKLLQTMQRFDRLAYFAVDEAHCVSEWGHSFRRDYLRLGELRTMFPKVPWIALTATASKTVVADICKQLRLQHPIRTFKVPCFRSNLFYDVVFKETVQDDFKHLKEYVLQCMGQSDPDLRANKKPCGIIYCRTREGVEQVAHGLSKHGVPTQPYHSGLDAKQLKNAQEDWMAGGFPVICATIAFGMGVDKATVRFVVHWDVPQTVANYYQESGRAGRDGRRSFCRIYYCRQAVRSINHLLQEDAAKAKRYERNQEQAKRALQDFQQMCTYCETVACRHKLFSNYFGDETPKCERMCDACANRKAADAALVSFQKLSMNFYTGGRISAEDGSDLYGGGRAGAKAEAEDGGGGGGGGDSSGEEYGSTSIRALAKQQTATLLQRQFALRKLGAAKEADMQPSARLARCRASTSTAVKVAGLSIQVRDSYLSQMAELLKENYLRCGGSELAAHELVYVDFEDVAAGLEYECFTRNKVVALYRRSCALETAKVKKATAAVEMFGVLRTHVPKQRAILGGDGRDMQQRFSDVAEAATHPKVVEKTQARGFKMDLMTQPTLNAFFAKSIVDKKSTAAEPVTDNACPMSAQSEADLIKMQAAIEAQLNAAQQAEEESQPKIPHSNKTEDVPTVLDDNETIRKEIEANRLEIERMNAALLRRSGKDKRDKERDSSHHGKSHKSHKSGHKSSRHRSRSPKDKKNDDVKSDHKHKQTNDKKSDRKVKHEDKVKIEREHNRHSRKSSTKLDNPDSVKDHTNKIKTEVLNNIADISIKAERRSISPAETVIKEEFHRSNSRCASPASTVCKAELWPREKRADSREHDFDDEEMIENLCRIEPMSTDEVISEQTGDHFEYKAQLRSRQTSEFSFASLDKVESDPRPHTTNADADITSLQHRYDRDESPRPTPHSTKTEHRNRDHDDRSRSKSKKDHRHHSKSQKRSKHTSENASRTNRGSSADTMSNDDGPRRTPHSTKTEHRKRDHEDRSRSKSKKDHRHHSKSQKRSKHSSENASRTNRGSSADTMLNDECHSRLAHTSKRHRRHQSKSPRANPKDRDSSADSRTSHKSKRQCRERRQSLDRSKSKEVKSSRPEPTSSADRLSNGDELKRSKRSIKTEARMERGSSSETVINAEDFSSKSNCAHSKSSMPSTSQNRVKQESRIDRAISVDTVINADVVFGNGVDRSADRLDNVKSERRRTEHRSNSVETLCNEEVGMPLDTAADGFSGLHSLSASYHGDHSQSPEYSTKTDVKNESRLERASSVETIINADVLFNDGDERSTDQLVNVKTERRRTEHRSSVVDTADNYEVETPSMPRHDERSSYKHRSDSDRNHHRQSDSDRQHRDKDDRQSRRDREAHRAARASSNRRYDPNSSEKAMEPAEQSTSGSKLSLDDPATFRSISLGALDNRSAQCQQQLAAVEQQIQLHAATKFGDIDRQIAVEQAHIRQQRDAHFARVLGTDNLDSWDDDEALSNVGAAREVRRMRDERAAQQRAAGQSGSVRVSLADQLSLDDLHNPVVQHDAGTASLIAAETDYAHMDLNGRISEMEKRFGSQMPAVLRKRILEEKDRISKVVCRSLQPYMDGNRIVPKMLFRELARYISHRFYACRTKEDDIKDHIRRIFVRLPCVRSLKDVAESKFL